MTLPRWASLFGRFLVWAVTILTALTMVDAGWGKFASAEGWLHWFGVWGYPPRFAYVIGALELGAGILLLIPRLAPYAAALLIGIMIAAFATVSLKESDLSQLDPLFNIGLLTIVLIARWPGWLSRGARTRDLTRQTTVG